MRRQVVLMHRRGPPMLRRRCASTTWTLDMPRWGLPLADGVVGEVGEVLCGVGDAVEKDEPVLIIETDKVSAAASSSASATATASASASATATATDTATTSATATDTAFASASASAAATLADVSHASAASR